MAAAAVLQAVTILTKRTPADARGKRKNAPVRYVRPVPRDQEVRKGSPGRGGRRARGDPEVLKVSKARLVLKAPKVPKASRVMQVLRVPKVLKGLRVPQVPRDLREKSGLEDYPVPKVRRAPKAFKERLVLKDLRGYKVLKVLKEL